MNNSDQQIERINITEEAAKVVRKLKQQHGQLMFHQSGGCCDGSAPMCFPVGELLIDDNDVKLGIIEGCDFYMSKDQYEYWKHTKLTVDITEGRGASFSLEIPLGIRFIIHSKLFSENELKALIHIK